MNPSSQNDIPVLTYKISRSDWEKGRASRRAITLAAVDYAPLRRTNGHPQKDAILRTLNNGERGLPFCEIRVKSLTSLVFFQILMP